MFRDPNLDQAPFGEKNIYNPNYQSSNLKIKRLITLKVLELYRVFKWVSNFFFFLHFSTHLANMLHC